MVAYIDHEKQVTTVRWAVHDAHTHSTHRPVAALATGEAPTVPAVDVAAAIEAAADGVAAESASANIAPAELAAAGIAAAKWASADVVDAAEAAGDVVAVELAAADIVDVVNVANRGHIPAGWGQKPFIATPLPCKQG